jgi:hypothetical protein
MILGPFLIKANLDGATKNRQISSKQNHVTHIVSITKNIQKYFVSPPDWLSGPFVILLDTDETICGTFISLRMDGSVSTINEAMETVIITIDIIAKTRAKFDDSGHSKTSHTARWILLTGLWIGISST